MTLGTYQSLSVGPVLMAFLIYLTSCSSDAGKNTVGTNTGSPLLRKTLAYHDPEGNWPKLKTRLYLRSTDSIGKATAFEIEMDNTTGYFAHVSRQDGKELVKGMSGGKEFYLLDGKAEISEEDRKKYGMNPKDVEWVHRFYGYLYGLPMKLTDAGAIATDAPESEELGGKTYQVLQVRYKPTAGKDNWFFYLDPQTYAMQAYKFNHGKPESGEYILLEQEETVQGIKIPKVRKWYLNKDGKYLGTDTLLKAEPLASPRA
ncbi:DUF6503 family protein [Rufibacter tibetensis]|uniref:DUF6503 family protein n=1 Tax=Rufibacter tibetensis TaxID=512763 RepID=UPI00147063E5|nr:DUF6503 family protein [Rufibacter tibetensis]